MFQNDINSQDKTDSKVSSILKLRRFPSETMKCWPSSSNLLSDRGTEPQTMRQFIKASSFKLQRIQFKPMILSTLSTNLQQRGGPMPSACVVRDYDQTRMAYKGSS